MFKNKFKKPLYILVKADDKKGKALKSKMFNVTEN